MPQPKYKAFGARLKQAMEKRHLNSGQLADLLTKKGDRVTQQAVSAWERGISLPAKRRWAKLQEVLHISEAQLFYGQEVPAEPYDTTGEALAVAHRSWVHRIATALTETAPGFEENFNVSVDLGGRPTPIDYLSPAVAANLWHVNRREPEHGVTNPLMDLIALSGHDARIRVHRRYILLAAGGPSAPIDARKWEHLQREAAFWKKEVFLVRTPEEAAKILRDAEKI